MTIQIRIIPEVGSGSDDTQRHGKEKVNSPLIPDGPSDILRIDSNSANSPRPSPFNFGFNIKINPTVNPLSNNRKLISYAKNSETNDFDKIRFSELFESTDNVVSFITGSHDENVITETFRKTSLPILQTMRDELEYQIFVQKRHFHEGNFFIDFDNSVVATRDFTIMIVFDFGGTNLNENLKFLGISLRDLLCIMSGMLLCKYGACTIDFFNSWVMKTFGSKLSKRISSGDIFIQLKLSLDRFFYVAFWSPVRRIVVSKVRSMSSNILKTFRK
jgi:hypothetical protein